MYYDAVSPSCSWEGVVKRVIKPALYLNALTVALIALVVFFLHAVQLSKDEPIFATRLGDLYVAMAAILVLVANRYQKDRNWLLVPILINVAELANFIVQLVLKASNANVPTDPQLIQPLVLIGVFTIVEVAAYLSLGGAVSE
jgi:hypothetical protein